MIPAGQKVSKRKIMEEKIPEWLRRRMMKNAKYGMRNTELSGSHSPEAYEEFLRSKITAEEMTPDEAEDEYQNRYNPEPRYCGREW